jgi:vacuolar-type H+-ATPase subunit E/Vma4
MTRIHIEHPTSATPERLLERFTKEILPSPAFASAVDRHEVRGNRLTFESSKGFSGSVEARDGAIVVDVALSGLAALMAGLIEKRIREELSRL